MSDIVKVLPYCVDLDQAIEKTEMHTLFLMGDNLAHRIELTVMSGGAPADLTGCTVTGFFTSPKNKQTVKIDGELKDGKAAVTLSKPCYTYHGLFYLVIQIKSGDVETSLFCGEGFMRSSKTETIIYDDYIIYDVSTLLSQIAAMETATKDTQTATDNANTAANKANAAAAKIDGMTVSAQSGDEPAANISEQNGAKHISFTLKTGATPDITFTAETGAPGTDVQIEQGGTAENPTLHLTIPRGADGNMSFEDLTDEQRESLRGPQGDPGVSPTVVLSPMVDSNYRAGTRVDISDAEGTKSFETWDGEKGPQGEPGAGIASGGTAGQVLSKKSESDYDTEWIDPPTSLPSGGTAGQVLSKKSETDYDTEWIDPPEGGGALYTNLADNSDFTHWVAQLGISVNHGGSDVYGGDRWILEEGTVTGTANADGDGYRSITLNGKLVQVVPSPPAVATAFVETVSGEATARYNADTGAIVVQSEGGVIKNVMLLEGEWEEPPEYTAKGYAAELQECMRYCVRLHFGRYTFVVGSDNYIVLPFALPTWMRRTPTIKNNASPGWYRINGNSFAADVSSVSAFAYNGNSIDISIYFSGTPFSSHKYHVGFVGGCDFTLSADLGRR